MNMKQLALFSDHRMEKISISIALSNPPNTRLLTQKKSPHEAKHAATRPDLEKISFVISGARNIIQSLILIHVLLRLLDLRKNVTKDIFIPSFQA